MMCSDEAIASLDKNKSKIKLAVKRLCYQLNYFGDIEELICVAEEKYLQLYGKYYDDKLNYMKFVFIVIKNYIKDERRKNARYKRVHQTEFNNEENGEEVTLDEISISREVNPQDAMIKKEICDMVNRRLSKDLHRNIFNMLAEGYTNNEIGVKLGFSQPYIDNIKQNQIYPVVKDVMQLDEKTYDKLVNQGKEYFYF